MVLMFRHSSSKAVWGLIHRTIERKSVVERVRENAPQLVNIAIRRIRQRDRLAL